MNSSIVKYTHFLNKLIIFLIEILNEEFDWIKDLIQHIKILFIFYNETSIVATELDTRVIKQQSHSEITTELYKY